MSRLDRRQARPPANGRRAPLTYTIRTKLALLVAACLVPALLVCTGLVYENYRVQKARIDRDTVLLARGTVTRLDRELARVEAGLRVLATSTDLLTGNLAGFQRQASDALRYQKVHHYGLVDASGQLQLNTLQPQGAPTGDGELLPLVQGVFTTGNAVVTPLFASPGISEPLFALAVPVARDNQIVNGLYASLSADRIAQVLSEQTLPNGWIAVVLDGTGTIVARSVDGERFVGQKAVPELVGRAANQDEGVLETVTKDGTPISIAFSRSSLSRWGVAVGAPKHLLANELYRSIAWLGVGALVMLGLGFGLAYRLARRLTRSVRDLIEPAMALGNGLPVVLAPTRLKEIRAVGQALLQASRRLSRSQYQAQHDALTGLSNRLMFSSLAQRQLALAQRYNSPVAVLAIDLDGFKAVNDQFGHAVGDRVLKTVAQRIMATIRASDTAARMGGDEFFVLLTNSSLEGAWRVADQLAQSLGQPFPDGLPMVSASIGVAVYPDAGTSVATLMESADQALYEAKSAGGGNGSIRVSGTS